MGDDINCKTADANCTVIQSDASADGFAFDAGPPPGDAGMFPSRAGLCSGTCSPDDPKSCMSSVDGGTSVYDAGSGVGCRVVLGAGQQTEATCGKAGTGGDGDSCTSGADCMAGYECVGTGTCRHYCCSDLECAKLSNTDGGTNQYEQFFCDVASEHASTGAIVPVCNLVVHCALFVDSCTTGEACTIVEVNNNTSLVATCDAVGDAKLGDSCETAHCASGFACLGPMGQRTCQQLCDTQHPCPSNSGMSCVTGSQALMQYKVGICN